MLLSSFRRAAKTGIVQVDLADPRGPEGIDPEAFKHIRELLMRKLSGGKHLRTE
jgi:hypothetical protein